MDEPTSTPDPISTSKIEELATSLKECYTIVIVTHNIMQQVVRISDNNDFFLSQEQTNRRPYYRKIRIIQGRNCI